MKWLRPKTPITWDNLCWALGECSRWLASWCRPWRWIVGFRDACLSLREE